MIIWYLSAYDQPKGHSSRTYDFSRELAGRGHEVTMFTNSYCHFTHKELLEPSETSRVEFIDGIRVVWMRTAHYRGNGFGRGVNMFSNVWRALRLSRTLSPRPDVVIGPSVPLLTGWAALAIAKMYSSTFVFEVRDIWPSALVDSGAMSSMSPVYHAFALIERHLYRKAKAISAVLPMTYMRVSECGSNPEKVKWIPNGAEMEKFLRLTPYRGGLTQLATIMYIGGYSNNHDVITIIRAASILRHNGIREFRMVLVGNGKKKPECQREAAKLGLDNIEFRETQPKTVLPELQLEADILVACVTDTPIYRYGLNLNKLVDYLCSGRPVVFSGSAPKNPVLESGCGFSIAPEDPNAMADALYKLISMSPLERVEMGRKGIEYAKKEFDIHKLGDRMEKFLLDAVYN